MATTTPPAIEAFIASVNAHDEAAFLEAFTEDGIVDDWGRKFQGRTAIKQWSDHEFIGAHGTMTVTHIETIDAEVQVTADWASTHANGLSLFTFALLGNKIQQLRIAEGRP